MKTTAVSASHEGFSLVELMVSLLLGAVVILAATRLFLTNQQAFSLQQSQAEAQESGRFAVDYILDDARHSGTRMSPNDDPAFVFPAAQSLPWSALENDATTAGRQGMGGGGTDRLVISYYDPDSATPVDCEGNAVSTTSTTPRLVVNNYYVDGYSDAAGGTLRCDGNGDTDTTGAEIVSGVDSFQVLYGTAASGNKPVRYVTGNNIGGNHVLAIRVALLMRSSSRVEKLPTATGFQVLDKLIPAAQVLNDQHLRRLFIGTTFIRNPI